MRQQETGSDCKISKGMVFGRDACSDNAMEPVQVGGGVIEMVNKFVYLGSCASANSDLSEEVSNCIGKASIIRLYANRFSEISICLLIQRDRYGYTYSPITWFGDLGGEV